MAVAGNRFFDVLDMTGNLAKTILYCLNPKDNEVMTTMAYNFNDGTVPGKMQYPGLRLVVPRSGEWNAPSDGHLCPLSASSAVLLEC